MTFYHSKGKLFLGVIVSLLFVALGVLIVNLAYIEESILFFALLRVMIVLFSFFAVANLLDLYRGYPYIMIMNEYTQLDSFTKSQVHIYFNPIESLKVPETSIQPIFEIVLFVVD